MELFGHHKPGTQAAPAKPTQDVELTKAMDKLTQQFQTLVDYLSSGRARVQQIGGKPVAVEQTASTNDQSWGFPVSFITRIANDGTDTIYIGFDGETTVSSNTVITLLKGESVTDLPIKTGKLFVRAKSGAQPFRAWGIE